jgi:TolB protein
MKPLTRISYLLSLAATIGFTALAGEELDIEKRITPGNTPPIKVNITGFSGEVNEVLNFDLFVMGFTNVSRDSSQFVITGNNNGNVQGRVTNPLNQTILSKAYTGASLRRQAHAFANDIVLAITGKRGIADTKIAFKVDTGANSEIYIADFDAHNAQGVTHDNTIVAAPAWVPGKLALYYTSYKLGNPAIFLHDLSTGQRSAIARYPGLNTSASVSSDGRRIALILSKSGSPDVYVCDADGGNLKQLTATREDESSPCWSPDGQWICFATKVKQGDSLRRALCKVPASGGQVQRISTSGISNPTEPDWSPDGKWIVFTAMMGGFEICVVPSQGGTATVLVSGEDPSWAPNSRTVVFARRSGGGRRLSLLDVPTKQYKDAARVSGSNSQPSWAR